MFDPFGYKDPLNWARRTRLSLTPFSMFKNTALSLLCSLLSFCVPSYLSRMAVPAWGIPDLPELPEYAAAGLLPKALLPYPNCYCS